MGEVVLFGAQNAKSLANKKPLICYACERGGCGYGGAYFVVFEDKSVYVGRVSCSGVPDPLIREVAENVPETRGLFGPLVLNAHFKRPSYRNEMSGVNLGMGNFAIIADSLLKGNETGFMRMLEFVTLVEETSNIAIGDIWKVLLTQK